MALLRTRGQIRSGTQVDLRLAGIDQFVELEKQQACECYRIHPGSALVRIRIPPEVTSHSHLQLPVGMGELLAGQALWQLDVLVRAGSQCRELRVLRRIVVEGECVLEARVLLHFSGGPDLMRAEMLPLALWEAK